MLLKLDEYRDWASHCSSVPAAHSVHFQLQHVINHPQVPKEKVCLAMTPTPIHQWNIPGLPEGIELHIKRDDLTGMQLSGNKVRRHANPSLPLATLGIASNWGTRQHCSVCRGGTGHAESSEHTRTLCAASGYWCLCRLGWSAQVGRKLMSDVFRTSA